MKTPSIVLAHQTVRATADEAAVIPQILRRAAQVLRLDRTPVVTDKLPSYGLNYNVDLLALGAVPVGDLNANLVGPHGMVKDGLWIDTALFCKNVPLLYRTLYRGRRGSLEAQAVQRAGDYREAYAATLLSASVADGARYLCPMRAGTLGVPGKPPLPADCPYRDPDHQPELPPDTLCGSDTGVVVPLIDASGVPTHAGRTFSSVLRLSKAWYSLNPMPRALTEGVFSTITTRKGQNLARGQVPVIGLPGAALAAALALHLHNRNGLRRMRFQPDLAALSPEVSEAFDTDPVFATGPELRRWYERLFLT